MANYHLHIKVISRAKGKSAVASSAYRSGEKLFDEKTGETFDYTRKENIIYSEVILPNNAPMEWTNRETLWNEVEKIETGARSQLAREIEFSLPKEVEIEDSVRVARKYVEENFVDNGMCADFCVHGNEGNPHVHVMLTMRSIDEKGMFLPKSEKEYKCRVEFTEEKPFWDSSFIPGDFKEEIYLTPGEIEKKKESGLQVEKLYKCKKGTITKELTASDLNKSEYDGFKKVSRYAVDRKRNTNDWNSKEYASKWREDWANRVNKLYKDKGLDYKVDHRSYEERGVEKVPSIHLGSASKKEKRGIKTERGNINRAIKEKNQAIKETNDLIEKYEQLKRSEVEKDKEKSNAPVKSDTEKAIDIIKNKKIENRKACDKINKEIEVLYGYGRECTIGIEKIESCMSRQKEIQEEINSIIEEINKLEKKFFKPKKEINRLNNKINELTEDKGKYSYDNNKYVALKDKHKVINKQIKIRQSERLDITRDNISLDRRLDKLNIQNDKEHGIVRHKKSRDLGRSR